MSGASTNGGGPEIDRINLRISQSFLEVVDESWKERGFNSRSEFIRYALRDAVTHPDGAGLWKDIAISEYQAAQGQTSSSAEVKNRYGLTDE